MVVLTTAIIGTFTLNFQVVMPLLVTRTFDSSDTAFTLLFSVLSVGSVLGALLTEPASKFPAFSTGPRACIGMKLATMEIRVVAANLLRQYRFALAEPNDGDYVVGITLSLKRPVCVNVTRAARAVAA